MAETLALRATKRADVVVRALRESDLPLAGTILRSAFDSFTGVGRCSATGTTSTPDGTPTRRPAWRPSRTGGCSRRSPDRDDRRAVCVELTERGRRPVVERDEPLMAAHVR